MMMAMGVDWNGCVERGEIDRGAQVIGDVVDDGDDQVDNIDAGWCFLRSSPYISPPALTKSTEH